MKLFNTLFVLLFLFLKIHPSTIAGYIKDNETKERIPYVNVYIKELQIGDFADSTGYFEIKNIDAGEYTLITRLIGYKENYLDFTLSKDENKFVNIYLKTDAYQMKGITINPEKSDFINTISISKTVYDRELIMETPSFIQADVLKSFQLLPSVTASSDYSSALYVRGGAPDQNLILFDNAPIFNPFHLGGMFSTFPVHIIDKAEFYAGGFDVSYGNRISSVIDLKTLIPDDKHFGLYYDVSLLNFSLYSQYKINDKLSAFINVRRTYFDRLLKLFSKDFPYYFYDIVCKINYRISQNSNISFSYFMDNDILNLELEDSIKLFDNIWGNYSLSTTYNKIINNNSDIALTIYSSRYNNSLNLLDIMNAENNIEEKGMKANYHYEIKDISFNSGIEVYENKFLYLFSLIDTNLLEINENVNYYAFYTKGEYDYNKTFIFSGGLRGEKSEFNRTIFISPRIGVKLFINKQTAVSANWGVYRQFITSVKQETNDFSSIFGEMWMPVYSQYSPQLLKQSILGIEHWIGNDISLSLEIYNKNYENIVNTTMLALFEYREDPPLAFNETIGKSNGIEFLIKKNNGTLNGWIGYAFSGTYIFMDSVFVPTYYDKRHSLNINVSYKLPYKISLGSSIVYSTGSPYTAVIGKYRHYYIDPETGGFYKYSWEELFSDYNAMRFPDYFRIDIGISKVFNIGSLKNKITLSVVNVTNHKNIFFYYYDHNVSPSERYDFTMLPILPSIGVSGEF